MFLSWTLSATCQGPVTPWGHVGNHYADSQRTLKRTSGPEPMLRSPHRGILGDTTIVEQWPGTERGMERWGDTGKDKDDYIRQVCPVQPSTGTQAAYWLAQTLQDEEAQQGPGCHCSWLPTTCPVSSFPASFYLIPWHLLWGWVFSGGPHFPPICTILLIRTEV